MVLSMTSYPLSEGAIPKYTALSYTWGASGRNVEVSANGGRTTITESLSEALRHMRKTQQRRDDIDGFWWIDMLCINQQCIPERNHQVAMMREIFQGASLVVAWLGTSDRLEYDIHTNQSLQVSSQASDHTDAVDYIGLPGRSLDLRETRVILSRPYWGRVWVIQELCVAKDIIIMDDSLCISWSTFSSDLTEWKHPAGGVQASIFSDPVGRLSVSNFRLLIPYNLISLREKVCNNGRENSLGSLLTFASQSEATNSRDRVYSLLGLANDVSEESIPLDYSLSPCAVYCAAIRVIYKKIRSGGSDIRSRASTIASSCSHNPLTVEDERRSQCDGLGCGAWWCCLDLALLDS